MVVWEAKEVQVEDVEMKEAEQQKEDGPEVVVKQELHAKVQAMGHFQAPKPVFFLRASEATQEGEVVCIESQDSQA